MLARYHVQVLQRAVGGDVSAAALAAMVRANLGQDSLAGLTHPVYHFDNSLVAEALAYIEECRAAATRATRPPEAWAAFGRLTHAAQDFYSHSNYVALWLERQPPGAAPLPTAIDGLDPHLLRDPRLITARVYLLDALCLIPPLGSLFKRFLPRDSHAWVNLDSPAAGPLFPYSIEAAVQRTRHEFQLTIDAIRAAGGERGEAAFRA